MSEEFLVISFRITKTMVLQLHPGEALKPKKEAERGETPTHNVKVYRRLDEGQRELVDNMRSCATSAILSLSILALFLLDCQQCARTSSRDRTPASAPARSSAGSRSSSSSSSSADSDLLTDECPEPNGYFADGYQCDKYYECIEGVINEKLCPDGMVFNDYSIQYEKCDLPFNIDCSSRPQLQEPKPSLNCPRLNGYFAHENVTVCDKFYYCVDGKYNMITCPSGLVYNEKTGICTWPDEAKKKHCSSEEVFQFECPKVDVTVGQQHPRYADPEDCQFFYVCINGEIPRRNGCKRGQVFNEVSGACDWPRNVPECRDWYKGILTDEELEALEHPKPKVRNSTAAAKRKGQPRPYNIE